MTEAEQESPNSSAVVSAFLATSSSNNAINAATETMTKHTCNGKAVQLTEYKVRGVTKNEELLQSQVQQRVE